MQAHKWLSTAIDGATQLDMRAKATTNRVALAATLTADQIAKSTNQARAWRLRQGPAR